MKLQTLNLPKIGAPNLVAVICAAGLACLAQNGEPTEADITRATASLLDRSQFSQRPLDDFLSSQFLDRYLDTLDYAHLLFLQSDLDEFGRFRQDLARKTLFEGDTQPAHIIFKRYLERLVQQENYAIKLLQANTFDFTGHDSWQTDRHDAPPPRDLPAAQALWRLEVRKDYLQEKLAGTPTMKIVSTLSRRYGRRLQSMRQLDADELLGIYLNALAHVYDPHSGYFGHKEKVDFNIQMNLSLVGIGGSMEVKGGYCVISELVPGGPAARSGLLKPGDRIVAVAQDESEPVDILGMRAAQVVDLIRGPKGSIVRLTILPAGASVTTRRTVSLVRDEIKFADAHAKATIIDLPQTANPALRIGVIDVPSFYGKDDDRAEGASADTARLIKKLKKEGVHGLILDLRRNGGGSTEEAIRLTGLFIPSGPVMQVLAPENDVEIDSSPEASALYDGPLVVLTSRLSASASEIVAGALQDYGRALIVGDSSTFGKGTMQNIVPLKEFFHQRGLGAVMVTIGKFYRPSGASTQLKGVVPDIILPSETDLPGICESKFPNALPWDILPTATYKKFDLVRPVLGPLREKSLARVDVDPGFRLVREELAMEQKDESSKTLSLNEAERRRVKGQADEIRAEMKKVCLADAARMPSNYCITLAEVDIAGLLPARKPTGTAAAASTGEINPDEVIKLREAENILADYIHAMPSPVGVLGAGTKDEITSVPESTSSK